MKTILAETAGFCFGVRRAVDMVYENTGFERIYTYGPIIHNEEVVEDLKKRGVMVLESPDDIKNALPGTVIIRAHGVENTIYDTIKQAGHRLVDATCPFVLKIHNIVKEAVKDGAFVIIVGDGAHPEVKGIRSCALKDSIVIADEIQAEKFIENDKNKHKKLCIVAQTTYNYNKFKELVEIFVKNSYDNVDVLNTICNATQQRQSEAEKIAGEVDAMLVIGGKNSSNTQKLYDICKRNCTNTFFIQTAADIDFSLLDGSWTIGITAGASTPRKIIEEVQAKCQN